MDRADYFSNGFESSSNINPESMIKSITKLYP